MPAKEFALQNGVVLKVYKRRGARNLRLSLTSAGHVRVTIPSWAPYRAGVEFAKSRQSWINEQRFVPASLADGQAIGKAHHLALVPSVSATKVSTRLSQNVVTVTFPSRLSAAEAEVQLAANKASIRALRVQAEQLLPTRLRSLAELNNFSYTNVSIKQLRGRWGSCDSQQRIVLNLYLMQLPWELIDYVILHELTHTKVLKHGPNFWNAMESVLPQTKSLKKQLREYQPIVNGST